MAFIPSQRVMLYDVVLLHRFVEGASACKGEVDVVESGEVDAVAWGASRDTAARNACSKMHIIEQEFPEWCEY